MAGMGFGGAGGLDTRPPFPAGWRTPMKMLPLLLGAALAVLCTGLVWLWLDNPAPAPGAVKKSGAPAAPIAAPPAPKPALTDVPRVPEDEAAVEAPAAQPDLEQEGRELARQGWAAVLARLNSMGDTEQRRLLLRGAFQHAATLGLDTAMKWARQLGAAEDRESAFRMLLELWGDPTETRRPSAFHLAEHLSRKGLARPAQLRELAMEFLQGAPRTNILVQIARTLLARDPVAAFQMGEGLEGDEQIAFLQGFASAYAAQNLEAAWEWSTGIPDLDTRAAVQGSMLTWGMIRDLPGAIRMLGQMPEGSAARLRAARRLATALARKDAAAAQAWLDSLAPENPEFHEVQRGIQDAAPLVGVGIALSGGAREGKSGPVTVQSVMQGGSAEQIGRLQAGDQIVGVQDGVGAWVNASEITMDAVVALIRGRQGTTVGLRVLPAGGGPVREVHLPRRELGVSTP